MQIHQLASTASVTTGIATAVVAGGVLAKVLENKELLVCFGKFAFHFSGVLGLHQLAGCGAFGSQSGFDFAGLHSVVVVDLAQLTGDTVEDVRKAALGLAATVGDLCLKIPLAELSLIADIGNVAVDTAELGTQVHVEICQSVADAVHILPEEIQSGFVPGGGCGIVDRKIRSKVGISIVAAAVITAETTTAESSAPATKAAPAKEQKPRQKRPHSAKTAHSAIHTGGHFPGIGRVVIGADRIDVVDRYCFHFSFPFVVEVTPPEWRL